MPLVLAEIAPGTFELVLTLISTFVMIFAFCGLAYLAMRGMAKVRDGEPARVRTCLTFVEPAGLDDEARCARLWEGLGTALERHGVTRLEPERTAAGLFGEVALRGQSYVLQVGVERGHTVVRVLDRGAATNRVSDARRPPLDGPVLRELVDALNRAVRKVEGVDEVRWFRRDAWEAGEIQAGAHAPV